MKWMATLIGGPCDGKVVEIVGTCYHQHVQLPRSRCLFATAIYQWDGPEDAIVGKFVGYFDRSHRLRKDGSRMPRKRSKR